MRNDVLLISPNTIRSVTTASDSLDDCYITPAILDAQLTGLQPIIGTPLYDKLCELVSSGAIEEPTNHYYKELLGVYVECYLVYQTQMEMLVQNMTRSHNGGNIQYVDAQTYVQNTLQDVKYLKDHYSNKAAFFAGRMVDYLNEYSNRIPEYKATTHEMSSCVKADTYRCGIKL